MSTKKEKYIQQLKPYLPAGFEEMVAELLLSHPVRFAITNPRATKLGDFAYPQKDHTLQLGAAALQFFFPYATTKAAEVLTMAAGSGVLAMADCASLD